MSDASDALAIPFHEYVVLAESFKRNPKEWFIMRSCWYDNVVLGAPLCDAYWDALNVVTPPLHGMGVLSIHKLIGVWIKVDSECAEARKDFAAFLERPLLNGLIGRSMKMSLIE